MVRYGDLNRLHLEEKAVNNFKNRLIFQRYGSNLKIRFDEEIL